MQQQSENDRSTVELVRRAEEQPCLPSVAATDPPLAPPLPLSPQELFLAGVAGLESRAALPAGVAGGY